MKTLAIHAGAAIAGIAIGLTANYIAFNGYGLIHYLQRNNDTMEISGSSPANTHCFYAKELGTTMYFVVEPGQQVPSELNLARNYEMAAVSHGYGEINQFTVRTVPTDPPAVHLSEITCHRT